MLVLYEEKFAARMVVLEDVCFERTKDGRASKEVPISGVRDEASADASRRSAETDGFNRRYHNRSRMRSKSRHDPKLAVTPS